MTISKRHFLKGTGAFLASPFLAGAQTENSVKLKISLAQWSLHRAIHQKKLDNLDFPKFSADEFGIKALEWVNSFFSDQHHTLGNQPKSLGYLKEMKARTEEVGAQTLLIMCDGVGAIGDANDKARSRTVEGHKAWLEAVKLLGGHSIRVNARSAGAPEEQAKLCADGLARLSELAKPMGLNVIVENHGGLSSNGSWLAQVMKQVGMENCGTLPDFGNFYVARKRKDKLPSGAQKLYTGDDYTEDEKGIFYDHYKGMEELMPYAKGVSAKANAFRDNGEEQDLDYARLMRIVKESGYEGYVGIEYEGALDEKEGIQKTQQLLERYL